MRDDGISYKIRAYVVDKITTFEQVEVPDAIRMEFSQTTPWPGEGHSGEEEIVIGMDNLAIYPRLIEIQGNLGVFKSPFSSIPI